MKPINEMTTAEILAEYNGLTGKNVKRFATRVDGEKRLAAARVNDGAVAPKKITVEQLLEKRPALRTRKPKKETLDRATAIRESWNSKTVAAARSARHRVKVDGEEYKSVAVAFKALGLPFPKHVRLRGEMVKNGAATFNHNGKDFKFKLVPAEK